MYNNELIMKLKKINNKIKKNLMSSEIIQNDELLTTTQGYVLGFIRNHNLDNIDVFQKDIEKAFRISKAFASEIVFTMEKSGYVKRVALTSDARYKKIIVTDLGVKKLEIIDGELNKVQSNMTISLDENEHKQLLFLLDKIEKNL